jgi:multimeric flavodoxin WrbA
VQKDEMQDIYPHLTGAAGIILAAPIFSMNINAQSKAMIDRCQRFWSTKYVLKRDVVPPEFRARRRGLFLSVCGRDDPRIFDCTVPTVSYFFHVIEVSTWEKLTYHNVDARGAIAEHATALQDAYAAGKRMAEALETARTAE